MTNTENMTIRKNTLGVSENEVVRDLEYVRAVGNRVVELLRAGHGLHEVRDGKSPISTIIQSELGICRQAVTMALRCLDLVHKMDKRFIRSRVEFKADLTKYGVGIAGDTVGISGLHASGVFDALRNKYKLSATTLGCWGAAISYSRELVDIKSVIAKIDAANPIDNIVPFLDSLAIHGSKNVGAGVTETPKKRQPKQRRVERIVAPVARKRDVKAVAPVKEVREDNAPAEPAVHVKRKYTRKDKNNIVPLNKHAVIGAASKSGDWTGVSMLNIAVSVTRKGGIATLTVGSVDGNGVNTSIAIKDAVKNYEGIDMAAMVHAISNTVRTAARK